MKALLSFTFAALLVAVACVGIGHTNSRLPLGYAGASGGGGGNPFTLTASGKCADASGGSAGCTISGINATGANLIIFNQGYYTGNVTQPTVTDSSSNTYGQSQMVSNYISTGSTCALAPVGTGIDCMYFLISPTVSGSMSFTCSATGSSFQSCEVQVWTRAGGAPTCDTSKMVGVSASSSVTTFQPGSITPGAANNLLLTGMAIQVSATTLSIDSGYTLDYEPGVPASSLATGLAYLKQTAATPKNPTWTSTGAASGAAFHMVCI